jgi:hypothetical protein
MLLTADNLIKFLDTTNKYQLIDWKKFFLFDINGNNLPTDKYSLITIFNDKFKGFKKKFTTYIAKNQLCSNFIKMK